MTRPTCSSLSAMIRLAAKLFLWTVVCQTLRARQVNIKLIGADCATGSVLILSACMYDDANTAVSPG